MLRSYQGESGEQSHIGITLLWLNHTKGRVRSTHTLGSLFPREIIQRGEWGVLAYRDHTVIGGSQSPRNRDQHQSDVPLGSAVTHSQGGGGGGGLQQTRHVKPMPI